MSEQSNRKKTEQHRYDRHSNITPGYQSESRKEPKRGSDPLDLNLMERRKKNRREKANEQFEPEKRKVSRRKTSSSEPLARYSLFNGLDAEQLKKISNAMRICKFTKGDVIIREGETGDEMYILLSGEIKISKRFTLYDEAGADQRDKQLIHLKDSDNIFFGEMIMFGKDERSATVSALTDVTLGILMQDQVQKLAEEDPSLGYHLFHNIGYKISANLRSANRDILKLSTAFVLALEGK